MESIIPPPPLNEYEEKLAPHSDLTTEAAPLLNEVSTEVSSAATVENRTAECPSSTKFQWTIREFSRLKDRKLFSDVFALGDNKWRILIFPKGNNVDNLSIYLDVPDPTSLPYGWSKFAHFSLAVVNHISSQNTLRKESRHEFTAAASDWGFACFMSLDKLYDPINGYTVNDTVVIEAEVVILKEWDLVYDSKRETGYVGLKNQGATCYMNSLLQTLFHIPYFRKSVYHMPTTENDMPSGSIPLALQSLFYKLQYSDCSVATKQLTKSFGWDTRDSFTQHDVQELNRVLSEKLEDKMKGTVVEGTIQQLFEGHIMNYIECINVDYKSSRKESFYDLQLDVKGCRDIYASFDKFVEVERLEGDNKYRADKHGLQDAKKGILFTDFPSVLQLQLKRFEYDFMSDTMVKVNDRYEFPLQLDLDIEDGKYLSDEADRSIRNLYTLHSVLVHSGGIHGGHYYAFIRPTLSDQWFKFDDERVTKEDSRKALEEQYGGVGETNPGYITLLKLAKCSSAYMLVYIRESDKDKIICNVDEKDIAEHLMIRLKKEQEEKEYKRRCKARAHLYTTIKVTREADLFAQIGQEIYFDLVDHGKVSSFPVPKNLPFTAFKEEIAKQFGVQVQFQRFWLWARRKNHTYRPYRPLTPQEEAYPVGQIKDPSVRTNNVELNLFLEEKFGPDLHPISPHEKTKEDILLFFKFYNPENRELRYVGRLFVRTYSRPIDILSKLKEMAGFDLDEEIKLYEEIKFHPSVSCELLDKEATFSMSQIEDGDIICFQKALTQSNGSRPHYPDVPSFLEYVRNRQFIHFRSLETPKDDDFVLELFKLQTYEEVVERVAHQIGLDDPSKIRLTSHDCYSQQPKPVPIKYCGVPHLINMLNHNNQSSDILYYEVLDIPLPELECPRSLNESLKVAFHHTAKNEVVTYNIRLPKHSTVRNVLDELKKKIPKEQKNLGPQDCLIHVYHFWVETTQAQSKVDNFGEPFLLVIHEDETLAEVKVRVQNKLQVSDEEFEKWRFAFLSMGQPEYLDDCEIIASRFQKGDGNGCGGQYLGLEHPHNFPKRSCTVSQNRNSWGRSIRIDN
ncbi:hypothetical protein SAY87_018696 [Trapa incisa]|uniref:ubiquitinyl hydrolase 1 n=1 Tax=Trapa incisa TaxID=236973 RepID=A0AAN7JYL1_9MYRT|nr:hypothetical protein SAY87_018696 [Trapa incisa]